MADPPVWRLVFDDHSPPVVVRCTVPTVEAEALLLGLVPLFATGRRQDVVEALSRLGPAFADSVLSWTVQHPPGRRVAPTRRGVLRVPAEQLVVIVRAWLDAWRSPAQAAPAPDGDGLTDLSVLNEDLPAVALVPVPDEPEEV